MRQALSAVLLAIAATGCSWTIVGTDGRTYGRTTDKYVVDESGLWNALRASAAHDVPCSVGQLGQPTPFARGLWRVEGCGKRVTYSIDGYRVVLVAVVSTAQ